LRDRTDSFISFPFQPREASYNTPKTFSSNVKSLRSILLSPCLRIPFCCHPWPAVFFRKSHFLPLVARPLSLLVNKELFASTLFAFPQTNAPFFYPFSPPPSFFSADKGFFHAPYCENRKLDTLSSLTPPCLFFSLFYIFSRFFITVTRVLSWRPLRPLHFKEVSNFSRL